MITLVYKPFKPLVIVIGYVATMALAIMTFPESNTGLDVKSTHDLLRFIRDNDLYTLLGFVISVYGLMSLSVITWFMIFPKEMKIDEIGLYLPSNLFSRRLVRVKYNDIDSVEINSVAGLDVIHLRSKGKKFKIPQMWFTSDIDYHLVSQSISFRKFIG